MAANLPTDVANQVLDSVGIPRELGDLEDGSDSAKILLRSYGQCRMQLLRSANWNFARKTAPMQLLADATGNTPYVGMQVPQPWAYEYAYPPDCMKVRYIPWNLKNQADVVPPDNIYTPTTPLVTGIGQQPNLGQRIRPARFVVATDFNYPVPPGSLTWDVQGVSPNGRTVILTNVREGEVVYTADMPYPSVWDSLFRAALVGYIGATCALPLWSKTDKKFGLEVRAQMIASVKGQVTQARLVDGNEATASSDIRVDWMDTRRVGGSFGLGAWAGAGGAWGGDGPGSYGGTWDSLALPDGSVF